MQSDSSAPTISTYVLLNYVGHVLLWNSKRYLQLDVFNHTIPRITLSKNFWNRTRDVMNSIKY